MPTTPLAEYAPVRDDLMTTGEAARLLGCTRQHVVNLCERGDLPFTSIGSHRRVARHHVNAIMADTNELRREERKSLWLAYAVAGKITADPEPIINRAKTQLHKLRPIARGHAVGWLDDWERLLKGPIDHLLQALTDPSPRGRELRQNSPFAGALSQEERAQALTTWKSADIGA